MPSFNTIDNQHVMHITYDMRIGGTEMVIKNIIDGLVYVDGSSVRQNITTVRPARVAVEGLKMSVLCIESPLGPFAEELQNNGIEFFELNRQPGFDTNLIKQIRQIIKDNNVDIIHCHQYTPWVYGVIAAAFTKTKVIFTEHGRFYPDSSTWKRKLINPILNLFTDQVTAISEATSQALIEFENIPEKSINVIYNGITPLRVNPDEVTKLRSELSIPENHTILGTIARFDPIKNHTMMLKAFSEVLTKHPNSTLIIIGDGDERSVIETCIDELFISKNVILTGYKAQPKNYLALMDVYLLSSLSEGTSMTLLEAMSLSKPCVVTDAGGNPEIVINNENGFITPNDNADEFAQGIMQALSSISNSNELGQASKNRFISLFSEKSMNKQYRNLYKQLK
jgi:glycosyltransferase involved in cell wall biosynthesis